MTSPPRVESCAGDAAAECSWAGGIVCGGPRQGRGEGPYRRGSSVCAQTRTSERRRALSRSVIAQQRAMILYRPGKRAKEQRRAPSKRRGKPEGSEARERAMHVVSTSAGWSYLLVVPTTASRVTLRHE